MASLKQETEFAFNIPIRDNKKLKKVIEFVENDIEINTLS